MSETAGSYGLVIRSISPASRRKTCRSSLMVAIVSPSVSASRPALIRRPRSAATEAASRRPARRTRLIRRSWSRRWWAQGRLAPTKEPRPAIAWKSIRPRGDARASSRRTYARLSPLARSSWASSTNCHTRMSWNPRASVAWDVEGSRCRSRSP